VADGPSVEADIQQYYAQSHPGRVQVLGADLYNGTATQLRSFKTSTGATYPLLLLGSSATGGNLSTLYGTYDNYIVIDPQGTVRYHAALAWPHGNRYHLNEIRAVVDDVLAETSGVPDGPGATLPGFTLDSRPNPFHGSTRITFTNPGGEPVPARVSVFDMAGRVVAVLKDGTAAPGPNVVTWDGSLDSGGRAASGRYLIRAELSGFFVARSVAYLN
jgi:hypothetical protein